MIFNLLFYIFFKLNKYIEIIFKKFSRTEKYIAITFKKLLVEPLKDWIKIQLGIFTQFGSRHFCFSYVYFFSMDAVGGSRWCTNGGNFCTTGDSSQAICIFMLNLGFILRSVLCLLFRTTNLFFPFSSQPAMIYTTHLAIFTACVTDMFSKSAKYQSIVTLHEWDFQK